METESVQEDKKENPDKFKFKTRDTYREHASELQRKVATYQAALYEESLYRLMQRSGDNTELINSLKDFLVALDHNSSFGDPEKPFGKGQAEKLTQFLKEKGEELRWLPPGGRPAK